MRACTTSAQFKPEKIPAEWMRTGHKGILWTKKLFAIDRCSERKKKYQFFSIECHWIYKLYLRLRSSCPVQIVIHDFCFVLFSSFFLFWFGFVYVYLIVCYYCFVFNREKGREVGWEELGEVGGGERMCSNILDETLKEYIKALKE